MKRWFPILLLGVAIVASAQDKPRPEGGRGREKHSERWKQREGEHKPGQWLRKYNHLPPEQQEKMLKDDPEFQKLPADRQQHLLERLRDFNQLPAEKRDRMIKRMERFEQMSPEQRQRLQEFQQKLQSLPEDRREMVRRAFRHLHSMSPEERNKALDSPRFKSMFTDKEQELIRSFAASDVDE